MTDDLGTVLARVRERVTPDADERARLEAATDRLVARTETAVADRSVEADVTLVGSTARDTWLPGDRDIDVFVRFDPDLPREALETHGLAVGHAVLHEGREEYAEHPYVTGEFEGFDIDLVPCYAVESATAIRSSVDRTPFHTRYLDARLDADAASEVRIAKAFLAAIGTYGSDLRTRGFSGYLVELLVLEHGGFSELCEAAAEWHPPIRIDPESHGERTFADSLVVIDPTDPERNVAAVVSPTNLARFQHHARELLADPRDSLFVHEEPSPLSPTEVRAAIADRGTTPVALRFPAPDVTDDQLYPQLEKSLASLTDALDDLGFDVLRASAFADESGVLFAECAVGELPAIERHEGPPVNARTHAGAFFEKYADADCYGPFVDGERYVVERERAFRTPWEFLDSGAPLDLALGVDVERAVKTEYEVLVDDEVGVLANEFGVELARYVSPRP